MNLIIRSVFYISVFVGVVILCACSRQEKKLTTGVVVSRAELQGTFHGDSNYAIVKSSSLPFLYENFADTLNQQGIVKWDERYDCNHFAALYVALSQARFAVATWYSNTTAQTLALAEVWYISSKTGTPHAIVAAQTEIGRIYIEPQTGEQIALNSVEEKSVYLCKW